MRRPADSALENPRVKSIQKRRAGSKKGTDSDGEEHSDGGEEKAGSDAEDDERGDGAAWVDEDELENDAVLDLKKRPQLRWLRNNLEETKVMGAADLEERLRRKLTTTQTAVPAWAQVKEEEEDDQEYDGEDDVTGVEKGQEIANTLLSSNSLLSGETGAGRRGSKRAALPKGKLSYHRLPDLNRASRSKADVTSARFHPNGELFMTAGLDKTVRIFQVDLKHNPKLQSIVLNDLPIHSAEFIGKDGTEVFITGPRGFAYSYDLGKGAVTRIPHIAGRPERQLSKFVVSPDQSKIAIIGSDGYILLLHAQTKQLIGTLRGATAVASICWTPDSQRIISFTHNAQIWLWDVGTQRCIARHIDDGSIHGNVVKMSHDGSYYATGNDSGIVNLYSSKTLEDAIVHGQRRDIDHTELDNIYTPKPLKEILTLKTSVRDLCFAPSNEILASASGHMTNSIRLTHLPSMTAFSNFPLADLHLGTVSSMDFSPHTGLFAVGSQSGMVTAFRLNHYETI